VGFVLCGSLEAVSDVFISWSQCNAVHCAALRELLNGVGATKQGFCLGFRLSVLLPYDAVLAEYMLSSCVCPS